MKSTRLHTITIAAATLLLLSGMYYAVPAGPRAHRMVTRDTEVTSVPAPVVDDTPINPDTAVKIRPGETPKNIRPVKQPLKRKITRR